MTWFHGSLFSWGELGRVPPLKLLYAGQFRPLKGVHLAVQAMALIRNQVLVELTIVGRGPEESRLKEEVRRLRLDQCIHFYPWIPKAQVLALHATHDAFLFPSLHDSSGTVVVEAIAHGRPVICLDLGGPAVTVDEHCARIVSTRDRTEEQVIQGIADAITDARLHAFAGVGGDATRGRTPGTVLLTRSSNGTRLRPTP